MIRISPYALQNTSEEKQGDDTDGHNGSSGRGMREEAGDGVRPSAGAGNGRGGMVAQDVPVYLDQIGKCVAREVVEIRPQVSGRITNIHFADGANIKKDDPALHHRSATFSGESSAG